jgi:hypothetical protein
MRAKLRLDEFQSEVGIEPTAIGYVQAAPEFLASGQASTQRSHA